MWLDRSRLSNRRNLSTEMKVNSILTLPKKNIFYIYIYKYGISFHCYADDT